MQSPHEEIERLQSRLNNAARGIFHQNHAGNAVLLDRDFVDGVGFGRG